MKTLIINPPIGTFYSLYASSPLLLGQLKHNNIDSDIMDMNINFLKEITSSEYLKYTKELLHKIYENNGFLNENVEKKYQLNELQLSKLNKNIETYLIHNAKLTDTFIDKKVCFYDEYINAIHSGLSDSKQNNEKYIKIFHMLLSFAFLPFYPEKIYINIVSSTLAPVINNPMYKMIYEDIKDKCSNKKRNIYINVFEKEIKEYNLNKYDVIFVTIPFEQNIYPALTLCKTLKEKTKAKVVIGGIIPTTTIDGFINHPDMFKMFFDNILIGAGEKSVVDYIKYTENKVQASEVSGLIYKKDNKIIKNNMVPIKRMDEIYAPNYDGINFNDYINNQYAEVEFSKGCYWHGCTFCYNNLWKKYIIQKPIKAADIIQELNEKYNIKYFHILDDALHINFAADFADEIIKRNLKIKYICLLRTEENLTFEVLKKLKQSGLIGIFFGIESASKRILNLMNKGINIKTAKRIIKDCYKLGIKADAGFMFGFPTETKEDIMKTIKFIKENEKYISAANNFIFHITKSSSMLTDENKKKFGITDIEQPEEFSDDIKYNAPGITREEIYKLLDENKLSYSMHTKWNKENEI